MHLLNAAQARLEDDGEAIDLAQTPGDMVFLSAADSELSALASAHDADETLPTLRLANILRLGHPMSVDLYVERMVEAARLVVVRLLGGRSYWTYGLDQLAAACQAHGVLFAALPGDDRDDPELRDLSTVDAASWQRLWRYFAHGGRGNGTQALAFMASLIGRDRAWHEPQPLLRAGLYWPNHDQPSLADLRRHWQPHAPCVAIVFYRALVQADDTAPIDALIEACTRAGLAPLPIYATSLKDAQAVAIMAGLLDDAQPHAVINLTGFAVSKPGDFHPGLLEQGDGPVLQAVLASGSEPAWRAGSYGLSPRDLAMGVALPEVDGRVFTRAISFKSQAAFDADRQISLVRHQPVIDRCAFVADLAKAWLRLRATPAHARRVAIVLANYPTQDGRLANGVGLDTPAGTHALLNAMAQAGYAINDLPEDGQALIEHLQAGVTNSLRVRTQRQTRVHLTLEDYNAEFLRLSEETRAKITTRWGAPGDDPHVQGGAFSLALDVFGTVAVGIQPARGYHIDPVKSYHDADLPPPHGYLAFYFWLRHQFDAHAILHMGKHGNLEWLPGKALALDESCFPEAILGATPHIYPFIVNDPGEGSQAKRRTSAVIIDHLTPPLTRAESYGPLRDLERLVDEYYEAVALDPRRSALLKRDILDTSARLGLTADLGLEDAKDDVCLSSIDSHLCELKELQIRDGLHVFGRSPKGQQRRDLLIALARNPRGDGLGHNASWLRALAKDLRLSDSFDPLIDDLGQTWTGERPAILDACLATPWRTLGDTVERLEVLAQRLLDGVIPCDQAWTNTAAVLTWLQTRLAPAVDACGAHEIAGTLRALDGRFVLPGPSGAPTRGRPDVLPTGRNFFSVDTRAVPTPAAWQLGWKSAQTIVDTFVQEHGDWPKCVALSAWGTANMRTGGDDIAQALALLGVRPTWDSGSNRVNGVEILPVSVLGRPRVDVTLRISGFFRDAFPAQIDLLDQAVRRVAALDEPAQDNPLAAKTRLEQASLVDQGFSESDAARQATLRIFGAKPGAYGAGLQALIDEKTWSGDADLADAFLAWGSYAYGHGADGQPARRPFEQRLSDIELVLHNQDNREHDILDSDDYYQFEGGLTATVRHLSGAQPTTYHNDHSRPDNPRSRPLKEEIGLIIRGRAANPKWIAGVMRHGYKGAFEIAATVDYLFAFAATTRLVDDHHFDTLYNAYVDSEEVRNFMAKANPAALREMADRFAEAIERGLWHPSGNHVGRDLDVLTGASARKAVASMGHA